MAAGDAGTSKTCSITVAATDEAFELSLLGEPAALIACVVARSGVSSFFLTASPSRSAAVVPLSASLPAGTALTLHRAAPLGTNQPQAAPAPLANGSVQAAYTAGLTLATPLLAGASSSSSTAAGGPQPSVPSDLAREAGTRSPRTLVREREAKMDGQLEGLERLSRLTTDLANERTLLAWVRTCLASIRTVFTYMAITGTTAAWQASVTCAEMMMATIVVATALAGWWRYVRVKHILGQKIPPRHFGRVSTRPLMGLIALTALATAVGIYSQQWEHSAHGHPE